MNNRRGEIVAVVAALAAVAVVVYLVLSFVSKTPGVPQAPLPTITAVPTTAAPSPSVVPTAVPTVTPQPTATAKATPGKGGIVRSDIEPTDEYRLSTLALTPAQKAKKTNTYIVKVETAVNLDPNEVAKQVQTVLDDMRGWVGYGNNNFELVTSESKAAFVIVLASPKSVDKLCAPLDTGGTWNCRNGKNVVLNTDRWLYMTPTYDDLDEYRAYMINHEVGHFLGLGHVQCPKPGGKAPVMMQQSINLGGCTPNAWPRESA